jgi:hypothetical protein
MPVVPGKMPGHVKYYHHIASSVVCKSLTLTLERCRRGVYSVPSERMGTLGIFPGTTGISKNSGKPYKNTNFDKEDILAKHKSFKSSLNIPINEENCELTTLYYVIIGTLYWI